MKIACIGEVMIELVAHKGEQANLATIGIAGDSYNTAAYLSMLAQNSDIEVSYITALGQDTFSDRIFSEIQSRGINTNLIERRQDTIPGIHAVETDEHGERTFTYWRGQAAAKTLFQEPCEITFDALYDFDLVYLSGISVAILPPTTRTNLIAFLKDYKKRGGKVAYDSNYRPRLWPDKNTAKELNTKMWALADIAFPSVDDEMLLFEDKDEAAVLQRLKETGVTFGALKRGAEGPLPISSEANAPANNTPVYEKVTKVVDTTAAGDSFNAGFLYQYANGANLDDALQAGHSLASKVIQASGAIVDIK
ncbi:MAG: sugar kinase [Nitratireductor sp.]